MVRGTESVAQRRFTVEEYHRMAEMGVLGPDERVELAAKFGAFPKRVDAAIDALATADALDVCLDRVLTADSLGELGLSG